MFSPMQEYRHHRYLCCLCSWHIHTYPGPGFFWRLIAIVALGILYEYCESSIGSSIGPLQACRPRRKPTDAAHQFQAMALRTFTSPTHHVSLTPSLLFRPSSDIHIHPGVSDHCRAVFFVGFTMSTQFLAIELERNGLPPIFGKFSIMICCTWVSSCLRKTLLPGELNVSSVK